MKKEVYFYIQKEGPISINYFRVKFITKIPKAGKALEELVNEGYIEEKDDLYAITSKIYPVDN